RPLGREDPPGRLAAADPNAGPTPPWAPRLARRRARPGEVPRRRPETRAAPARGLPQLVAAGRNGLVRVRRPSEAATADDAVRRRVGRVHREADHDGDRRRTSDDRRPPWLLPQRRAARAAFPRPRLRRG